MCIDKVEKEESKKQVNFPQKENILSLERGFLFFAKKIVDKLYGNVIYYKSRLSLYLKFINSKRRGIEYKIIFILRTVQFEAMNFSNIKIFILQEGLLFKIIIFSYIINSFKIKISRADTRPAPTN